MRHVGEEREKVEDICSGGLGSGWHSAVPVLFSILYRTFNTESFFNYLNAIVTL